MEREKTSVVVSSLLIEREGKILFLEEDRPEGLRLNLPGGHVDPGESPQEAAIREGKEETGFDLNLDACAGALVNTWKRAHSIRVVWRASIVGGELKTESNAKAIWLTYQEYLQHPPDIQKMNGLDEMVKMVESNGSQELVLLDRR